jgi:hypothetical protein
MVVEDRALSVSEAAPSAVVGDDQSCAPQVPLEAPDLALAVRIHPLDELA